MPKERTTETSLALVPSAQRLFPWAGWSTLPPLHRGTNALCELLKGKDTYSFRTVVLTLAFKKNQMASPLLGTPLYTNVSTHINIKYTYIFIQKCFQSSSSCLFIKGHLATKISLTQSFLELLQITGKKIEIHDWIFDSLSSFPVFALFIESLSVYFVI